MNLLKIRKDDENKVLNFINSVILPEINRKYGNDELVVNKVNKIGFFVSCDRCSIMSAYSYLLTILVDGDTSLVSDIFDDVLKY